MEGGEAYGAPRFCIEVNVPRVGQKLAVLRLHHGASPDSAVEVTVDLHCKTLYYFCHMNIFSIVLSKKDNFLNFH